MPRPALARLVQRAIDRMDDLDGDPDFEPNDDEFDTSNAEDERITPFTLLGQYFGSGCSVADPVGDVAYAQ